jgi:hypothetical protein
VSEFRHLKSAVFVRKRTRIQTLLITQNSGSFFFPHNLHIGGFTCHVGGIGIVSTFYTEYLMPATKKSKVDLATELGIDEQPEVSSHVQKLLNRKTRDRTQAFKDWADLVEAKIAKEYVPDNLAQEVFDEINDNRRLTDGFTALINDARDLQRYRTGLRQKEVDHRGKFVEQHGDRASLVAKLQALKTETAEVKALLREYDSLAHLYRYTADKADHIKISNHRLFPHT